MKQYLPIGKHVIFDLTLPEDRWIDLDNYPYLTKLGNRAIKEANTHLTESYLTKYRPQGLSLLFQLEESHLSLHTYPECGVLMGDFFTCGADADPEKGVKFIIDNLRCNSIEDGMVIKYQVIHRGKG